MKKFLERGETYSFFNLKNILAGLISMLVATLFFLVAGFTGFTFSPEIADLPAEPTILSFVLLLIFFILPVLFMSKRHGWKSGISTVIFGVMFLTLIIFWIFYGGNKIIQLGV